MKITRRDLSVIMILAGILIVFLVYQMSFKDTQAKVEELQTEQKNLKSEIEELQPIVDNAEFYQTEMARFDKELSELVKEFPVDVIYEDGIMYAVELTDEFELKLPSVTVTPAAAVNSVEGVEKNYTLLKASEVLSYNAEDYETTKNLLDYIYSDDTHKRKVSSVAMSFDSTTGAISGTISVDMFAFSDGTRTYEPVELPLDSLGVDCIFGEVTEQSEDEN